jgi:4'-phosphopantetheinyl transferase
LRLLLGHYSATDPPSLRFVYNPYGKPTLADVPSLHFNLSHAGDLILYAFAYNRRVGIDVELVRNDIEIVSLARHIFSQKEQRIFFALPPDQQIEAFFNGWTRKEAYVKARGLGFALPLDGFDVSLHPGEAALLQTRDDPDEAARWSLRALEAGAGYKAALAVEGIGWRLVINDS